MIIITIIISVVVVVVVVLMKNRICSEYVPMMKALIVADLMYYRIVIVEALRHNILITL